MNILNSHSFHSDSIWYGSQYNEQLLSIDITFMRLSALHIAELLENQPQHHPSIHPYQTVSFGELCNPHIAPQLPLYSILLAGDIGIHQQRDHLFNL